MQDDDGQAMNRIFLSAEWRYLVMLTRISLVILLRQVEARLPAWDTRS